MFPKTKLWLIHQTPQKPKLLWFMAVFFFVFTPLALSIDSVAVAVHFTSGRIITNFLAVFYFGLMFFSADGMLRQLMLHMVWLSYIGELIFCEWLQMYHYRTPGIPLYVPFGHAIVYASGYVWAHRNWAARNELSIRKIFTALFLLSFVVVGWWLNDIFTLLFGSMFFVLLRRKRWQNLYYFIAVCVVFIELFGTYFGCWTWVNQTFGCIPTANPPIGAVFFYAGGDVLLAKIVQKQNQKSITQNKL